LASTAQAMRASLLAKATAATLPWARVVSWASHALRPEDCFAFCWRTARAPCTKGLRKYEFPRLLIPSSFCLPPVVYSPGTTELLKILTPARGGYGRGTSCDRCYLTSSGGRITRQSIQFEVRSIPYSCLQTGPGRRAKRISPSADGEMRH
jgi:hypothetical protein